MSSVAGGMKSEIEHNMQSAFTTLATQTGFVRRDEFDSLLERFEQAVQKINLLETELNHIKNTFIAKD
jgi:BMFP domain-containing protein YqiC